MVKAFDRIRPRVWSNGTQTIILPCDKRSFHLYATSETFTAEPIGKFRTLENAAKAADRLEAAPRPH